MLNFFSPETRAGRAGRWIVLGFWILAGLATVTRAAPATVRDETQSLLLSPHVESWRDASGEATLAEAREAASAGRFRATADARPSFGFTADAVWLRVPVRSERGEPSRWFMELMTARLDEVDWFILREDGRVEHRAAGNLREREAGAIDSRYPILELELGAGEAATVFARVRSQTSVNTPLRLWEPAAHGSHEVRLEWARGIFFGYLASLLVFGLAFAVVTRERVFVFFLVAVFSLVVTFLAQGGYPMWLDWPQARLWTREGMLASMLLTLSASGLFLRSFFGIDARSYPRLNRLLMVSVWTPLAVLAWAWIGTLRGALAATNLLQLAAAVLLIGITVFFRNRQIKGYRFFVLCWVVTMSLHGLITLQLQGWLPMWTEWELLLQAVICFGTTCFLGVLGEQVREMRREKERAQQQALKTQTEAAQRLEREVGERTEDLRLAKEKAEEASRFKSLFLANISHEIRAPLSTVTGLSQAMWLKSESLRLPEDFTRALQQMRAGGEYLNLILINLLDVSAAEAGRLPVYWELIDPAAWSESLRNLIEPIAASHGVELRWEVRAARDARVETDAVRLTQILLNVAHNALKFTPVGSLVAVNITQEGDELRITVEDEGPGIPEEQRTAVFEPFSQAEARERGPLRGVGLGLSVVRLNADLLGARLEVSRARLGGTLFGIHLPARRPLREF